MSDPNQAKQISDAVNAHTQWKMRLLDAAKAGTTDFTPDTVGRDDQCPFGKWLHGPLDSAVKGDAHYGKVLSLHGELHNKAAGVVEMIKRGDGQSASQALGPGTPYALASANLVLELSRLNLEVQELRNRNLQVTGRLEALARREKTLEGMVAYRDEGAKDGSA